ncbi:hypothetical protein [Diaphorobacter sp.]|jgi:hypothetical protein|uniref:hypothetical protein n=1 Tax=Diaphorobacter sp. TaxID=1934310 RepID=UPI00258D33BA|nr:hypothetical protein [Diaphorobacter sp.]
MTPQATPVTERRHAWSTVAGGYNPAPERSAGFIKGPLPLDWMQQVANMPGKTLQVGLTLWYLSGLQKSKTVKLATKQLAAMGVSRDAKYEALERLRSAGLIAVEQQPGSTPTVTLLLGDN